MIKFLLRRPIAIFMAFTACFIVGMVTYNTLPISLLPDIAIPEITVQVTGDNTSARELENTVMRSLRSQLMQVSRLEDMRSETRDGSGLIRLHFEYGTNTDLAFIEVNEKIDAAMSYLPRTTQRPRVIKASATDIPVLYLNLTLKDKENNSNSRRSPEEEFLELSDFAENVIRRRIEQLPEIAMVDITGVAHKQVQIIPDLTKMEALGLAIQNLESALSANNVEPGSMIVRDGYYEYNIRFSTVVRTLEDVQNIYLRIGDRIMQMHELADIQMMPTAENGLTIYNGKRSITLAVIKQAEENMDNMKKSLNGALWSLERTYPGIQFNITRNQTELLDYTLSNLQQNLTLGFLFIIIVAILFLGDVRSPLVIGISMIVAIVISFIFFYLFDMSLNIISLSGLILAEGMMIDNAIIVTENIAQYQDKGCSIEKACQLGTEEVIAPMLSSSLTTIAVFVPLVFLSGIGGAIFYDEAFAVTVGLASSYFTGIILLPVLYKMVYKTHLPERLQKHVKPIKEKVKHKLSAKPKNGISKIEQFYNSGINFTFTHKRIMTIAVLLTFPLCVTMFYILPKEKMPEIDRTELMARIDWNENIHLKENKERIERLGIESREYAQEHSSHIGIQQYLLEKEQLSTTEADIYFRTTSPEKPVLLQNHIQKWIANTYPLATVTFYAPENIFEKIFDTNEADIVVELYNKDKERQRDVTSLKKIEKLLHTATSEEANGLAFEKQLNLTIDRQKLLLYGITYDEIMRSLKTALRENQVATLRSFQNYLPIVISGREQTIEEILNTTLVRVELNDKKEAEHVPLMTFISQTPAEDLKTITAGRNGEYIALPYQHPKDAMTLIEEIKNTLRKTPGDWEANFSGAFFSSHQMINELTVILFISLLLMYFVLAAQFESFMQPLIVLMEIPIDIAFALVIMSACGITLNLMSAIGIVVSCGIIINDSILKLDVINTLRLGGMPIMEAIHTAGVRRLRAIIMTSLTTILAMVPLLFTHDMGSELQKPLAIAMIATMAVGTLVSLFIIPLIYWFIYRNKKLKSTTI